MLDLPSLSAVGLVVLATLLCGQVDKLEPERRNFWKSAAGGTSAAFIFVVLFPKLVAAQAALTSGVDHGFFAYLNHHSSLIALVGLLTFWAFERKVVVLVARLATSLEESPGGSHSRSNTPVWSPLLYTQALMFSAYAGLVGYLIAETTGGDLRVLALYTLAMALHFLGLGLSLRYQIGEAYDHLERWLLAAALLFGWLLAQLTELSYVRVALLNSLFAGMLIYFVIKNEVPSPSKGRFKPLLYGAVGYSILVEVTTSL